MLKKLCNELNIEGIEVSSKTGENILKSLEILSKSIIEKKTKEDFHIISTMEECSKRKDLKKNKKPLKFTPPNASIEKPNLSEDKKTLYSTSPISANKNPNLKEDKILLPINIPNISKIQNLKDDKCLPSNYPNSTKERKKEFSELFLFKYINY